MNTRSNYTTDHIKTLEQLAPGSADIGKKLQALRDFKDIVSKGDVKGKGSQLISAFRPVFTGATAGFMGGSVIPGGSIPGAAIGAGSAILASSSQAQRFASKALTSPMSLPPIMSKAGQTAGKIGVTSRTLSPQGGTPLPQIELPTTVEKDTTYTNDKETNIKSQEPLYITGYSPKAWMKAKIDAEKIGNHKIAQIYFDNDKALPWYNVPQHIRTRDWPEYDRLPITGLDPNSPSAKYSHVNVYNGVTYLFGEVNYANWPMIVSKEGNKKMFIDTKWAHPYEQTWSSHMYQLIKEGKLYPGLLLASPIWHERILYYKPEERREN
jgi:hypothetical protein